MYPFQFIIGLTLITVHARKKLLQERQFARVPLSAQAEGQITT